MSLLFPDRARIRLSPAEVALMSTRGRRVAQKRLACDPAYGNAPWQGALAALESLAIEGRCAVTVVLASDFVRYALVPWSEALSGEAEEQAYVRHHFARIHGERARAWAVRASEAPSGAPRLASAIDAALLEAIRARFPPKGKAKLVSVQPALMAVFNRARAAVPRSGAWIALGEQERACVALHRNRRWHDVQVAKGSWQDLLERMRFRVEGAVPDLVLLHSQDPGAVEAPGWKVQRIQ